MDCLLQYLKIAATDCGLPVAVTGQPLWKVKGAHMHHDVWDQLITSGLHGREYACVFVCVCVCIYIYIYIYIYMHHDVWDQLITSGLHSREYVCLSVCVYVYMYIYIYIYIYIYT